MKTIFSCLIVLILSGCVSAPQRARNLDLGTLSGKGEMVTMPGNLRTIDIRKADSSYVVCSEPMPDIAMSNVLKLAIEASEAQKVSGQTTAGENSVSSELSNALGLKGNSEEATTALELAGRTQIVLLAREFLYRNCVARENNWIKDSEFEKSQNLIIDQISNMIATDKAKAEADKAKAKATEAAAKAILDKKTLENVTQAVRDAKTKFCLDQYDSCFSKAKGDEKKLQACRNKLAECNK